MNLCRRWLPLLTAAAAIAILLMSPACDKGDNASDTEVPPSILGEFTFVHMTDLHLDNNPEHLRFLEQVIGEINTLEPDFVVITGDLIDAGETLTIEEAKDRFAVSRNLIDLLTVPVHLTLGNHDIIGGESDIADPSDPAFGNGLFIQHFGPTYYAFDWEGTRCIVLDPNDLEEHHLGYRIGDEQRQWLMEETKEAGDTPILVFFHEPSADWEDRDVLRSLDNAIAMFSGHWHYNLIMDSLGIPEQVTGALCGEWWYGPGPDGYLPGYRIVRVGREGITSAYKEVGKDPQPYQAIDVPPISSDVVPVGKVLDNFEDSQGCWVTIEGTIKLIIKGPPFLAEGAGAFLIEDDSGVIGILAEMPDNTIASLGTGDRVKLVGVPLQYSMKWLMDSEHHAAFELLTAILPEGMVVSNKDGEQRIRLMRWFSEALTQRN